MTREEHIYQLEQYLRGHSICMCPSSSLYWQEHWEEVIKTLEQEVVAENTTSEKTEWIPVNKELPVTNDEVLVTYIVNGNYKKRFVETANCYNGEWCSVNDEYRIPYTKVEIIAWQHLPKPYSEVSE